MNVRIARFGAPALAASVCAVAAGLVLATGVATAASQDTLTATCTVGTQTLPCTTPWFTAPVQVVWQAEPAPPAPPTPPPGCQLGVAYTYSTDTATSFSCTATWSDGTQVTLSFPFHVEVSAPQATALPSRPPDAGGWYNHPVSVSFTGNAFSGITSCSPDATYGGPDTVATTISGACLDAAGKTAGASIPLRYDATPPAIDLSAVAGDASAGLSWNVTAGPAPLAAVSVTRSPGIAGAPSSLLSAVPADTVTDSTVGDHITYTYTVSATDAAGNTATRSVTVTPAARLLTPPVGARLAAPPVLTWTPVRHADYYNVQVFHGGKVLSAWPRHARLRMQRSWRYHGRRHRLTPGRYRWYVWPGFGRPARAHYGRLVGTGTFVVR